MYPSFLGGLTSSTADVNPIGAISKTDLKKFIAYARDAFELPVLTECVYPAWRCLRSLNQGCCRFLDAVPTAELEPITEDYVQADEADMGMTYDELSVFGRLRKVEKCGPWSMFTKLVHEWGSVLSPLQVCSGSREVILNNPWLTAVSHRRWLRRSSISSSSTQGIDIR